MTEAIAGKSPLNRSFFLWQLGQLIALILFLAIIYQQESQLVDVFSGGEMSASLVGTDDLLRSQQLPFLPGKLWKSFVCFLAIALCLLTLDRWRFYVLTAFGALLSLLMIGDRIYFLFFTNLLSIQSIHVGHQAWAVKYSVLAELKLMDVLPFLGLGLLVFFGHIYNKAMTPGFRKNLPGFIADRSLGLVFLILAFHLGQNAFTIPLAAEADRNLAGETRQKFELSEFVTSSVDYALHFGLLNYHLNNIREFLNSKARPMDQVEKKIIKETLTKSYRSNAHLSALGGIAKGKSVIIISMEAFQHYIIGLELDGQPLTPFLNELQHHSLSFDYIVDNIARGGTSDAEFSVLTGLMPNTQQIVAMNMPTNPPPISMPELLAEKGYHTLSLHGYLPAFWNRSINHPAMGFKEMIFQNKFTYVKKGLGVPDETFFEQSVSMLAQRPRPFFAFMISLSSHHPYSIPISDHRLHIDMPKSTAYNYFQAVHYADAALGIFFKKMAEEQMLDETIFVIYGDHAAPMDEVNSRIVQRKTGIDPSSIRQKRVPLFIYSLDLEPVLLEHKAEFQNVVGGLQDVLPTILHLLGERVPFGVYGTHLLQSDSSRPISPFYKSKTGFIQDGFLYVKGQTDPFQDSQGMLYHADGEPPGVNFKESFIAAYQVMLTHQLIFDKKPDFRKAEWAPLEP